MHYEAWRQNTMYLYYNEEKIDYLLVKLFGSIQTQFQESEKHGSKTQMKLAARFGTLLAWLGLGEATAELSGESGSERTATVISTMSVYNKIRGLMNYYIENELFPGFDLDEGHRVSVDRDGRLTGHGPPGPKGKIGGVGRIAGMFNLRRLDPPPDKDSSVVRDLLDAKANLWICESTEGSSIKAEIPFITSNFRKTSQLAMVKLHNKIGAPFPISAVGILSWENEILQCDPLAWGLFALPSSESDCKE